MTRTEGDSMISMDKVYRTRDRREVRIYAVDGEPMESIHGAILDKGSWYLYQWRPDGSAHINEATSTDLIEVKPEITRHISIAHWRNRTRGMCGAVFWGEFRESDIATYIASIRPQDPAIIGVTHHEIIFTPGDGL